MRDWIHIISLTVMLGGLIMAAWYWDIWACVGWFNAVLLAVAALVREQEIEAKDAELDASHEN